MPSLVIPPPARMGLLVAAKYARSGYAIRRAVWNGGVTLQTPTPTGDQIAAAHVLAWVTYAPGLYTYSEPVNNVSRVAQSLDALLADYTAADWTVLPPDKDNDDVLNPPPPSGGSDTVSSDGKIRVIGGGTGVIYGAGSGYGGRAHDCGQGMYWDGTQHQVFACEGGHTDFAPRNQMEIELLQHLQRRFGHVSYERAVSGPGLVNLYQFLRDTGRAEEPPGPASSLPPTTTPAPGRQTLCRADVTNITVGAV